MTSGIMWAQFGKWITMGTRVPTPHAGRMDNMVACSMVMQVDTNGG
eukprot:CAMPEP_0202871086 /NCGR_PEP_ID=MMETSP1391-20130828/17733_1 /ASSEMBLY_ACC=CAM_ASM_000867 /TAXON_ID=1034604 /ORGANISM="Chlamydomonas leiostraca, Strain SAG 11-49" /LENGTH=45 /DNA_ID= /DNA_START= /DNA_END= /DNA_ORIENTATION=